MLRSCAGWWRSGAAAWAALLLCGRHAAAQLACSIDLPPELEPALLAVPAL
ncbi:MAG: hypothetical protein U0Z44_17950 [Kouleothrix sp.]